MACNKLFGAGIGGQIGPTDPDRYYKLGKAELAVIDRDVHALLMDLQVIIDIVKVIFTLYHFSLYLFRLFIISLFISLDSLSFLSLSL